MSARPVSCALIVATVCYCSAVLFGSSYAEASDGWRSYEVYRPTITRHAVIDAGRHDHKYNHCSTIAWFEDRWICIWGSHVPVQEHTPGQRMVFSTSRDGRNWSPIKRIFSNEKYCDNPVEYPEGKGHQWQPNLGVVDGQLWVLWNQGGSLHDFREPDGSRAADLRGLYLSQLDKPDGKWVNRRLDWNGESAPTVDGRQFSIATTQNLYRLRSGRVLAPVTLRESGNKRAHDAPEGVSGWWAAEKRNAVVYTDDLGRTWHLSSTCQTPGFSWVQWEPTVWQQPDGSVMMFARNNTNWSLGHQKPDSGQYLLWSVSRDEGETWTPHRYVPLESVCSRMHVAPLDGRGVWEPTCPGDDFAGRRMIMVHNDAPGAIYSWADARTNLALFFTRGGGFDFVAGNNISAHQPRACYPQMWRRGDTLAVSYTTSAPGARSIYVALVSPLPEPDRYYIFPRFNDVPRSSRPTRVGNALAFHGSQHVAMREVVDPGSEGVSFGAWVRDRGTGILLDTRAGGGFNVMIESKPIGGEGSPKVRRPAVCMLTKPHVFGPSLDLSPPGSWHYIGLTADNSTGEAVFYVDDRSETVRFEAPLPRPLKGAAPHVGAKSLATSGVPGLTGDVRFAALYAGPVLRPEHHRRLYNRFAGELGRRELNDDAEPSSKPIMWMDPADGEAFERDFIQSDGSPHGGSEVVTIDGRQVLRLRDHGSAGVDLDENDRDGGDRVYLNFRFKIESGDRQTLCTVGDLNQPARLVARDGGVFLCADGTEALCGPINADGWTPVSIETYDDVTRARVGQRPAVEVHHEPEATWIYLGEGYPEYGNFPGTRLLIEVESVRTRVDSQSF